MVEFTAKIAKWVKKKLYLDVTELAVKNYRSNSIINFNVAEVWSTSKILW